jgi:condensin complex subunit 1
MAPVFVIPTSLRDLEAAAENGEQLCAQEVTDVENLSAHDVNDLVKGTYQHRNSENRITGT